MSEELNEIEEVEETEEVKTYDFPEGTVFYQEIREEDGYKSYAVFCGMCRKFAK